jgi:hypothetical protein
VKLTSYELVYYRVFCRLTTLPPVKSKYFLSTLFSNTLYLCSSLSMTDQVSYPYKTTGKIIFSYILIFKFLERIREDKRMNRKVARISQI